MGARAIKIPDGTKKKKKLLGLIEEDVPKFRYSWQKNANMSLFSPKFYPHDYKGESYGERKKNAWEDARRVRNFYQDLVDQKVLPEGTSIKVRRIRHQDGFGLEFFMPHLKEIPEYTSLRQIFLGLDSKKDESLRKKFHQGKERCIELIEKTAQKYGYKQGLGEDVYPDRNYGLNKNGEVRIHDIHLLSHELPSKFKLPENQRNGQFYGMQRRREDKGERYLPIILGLSVLTLFFLNQNTTGFAIKDFTGSINFLSSLIFVIILFFILIIIRRKIIKSISRYS